MNFSQIPGQREIREKLIRSVKEQRVSHAQLFAGPEGSGGMALALAYARYISCENRNDYDSCGVCKSCVKYDKMIHPDLHFVFPIIKTKKYPDPVCDNFLKDWRDYAVNANYFRLNNWLTHIDVENAQGLIFSSEASEIIRKINLKTYESEFKIMIIWLPEKMHQVTANKLLKMIEEPPEKTIFLLVSEDTEKIIPTIRSRCQLIKIPAFTTRDIEKYLISTFGLTQAKAADLARVSNGSMARATELCENQETNKLNLERFQNLMRYAWKRDITGLMSWSEEIAATGREPQKNFLLFSLRLIRENLMLTLGQQKNNLVYLTGDEQSFSEKFHPFIKQENVYQLSGELNLAHSHIEANGNAKIIFLDLALKTARLIR